MRNTDANKKKRISSLFLDYLACTHPYYSKFFLDLGEENVEFALECLSSGKGGFSYEVVTGFNSLSATPKIVISGTSKLFTLGSGMKESLRTNQRGVENCLKCSGWETWVILMTFITSRVYSYLVWSWSIDGKKSRMKLDLILDASRLKTLWVVLLRESSQKLFWFTPEMSK